MFNFLEKWRGKDERSRRVLALSISAGITLIIVAIWASVFFSSVTQVVVATSADNAPSPFATLKADTTDAFQNVQTQFGQLKSMFASIATTTTLATTTTGN